MRTHDRLTEMFTEAVGLDPAARVALVEKLRRSESDLAAKLEALLAADQDIAATALQTGGLADTAPSGDGLAMTAPTQPDGGIVAVLASAPRIDGYRIVDVLGTGGMGTVYAAEQQAPRRLVAIKILHAPSRAALVRFWAEAEILGRLEHPGIVRVFEAGDADARPYLVMERVDGVRLDTYVRGLSRARKLDLIASIAEAVHHAHVNGVIHRDLKPANVVVREGDRVTVLDFGVARVTSASAAGSGGETRAGELIGTPLYMSPEQAKLRADQVDARSDVYSLGVMAYEIVTGELPYDVRDRPLPELARAICEEMPRRAPGLERDVEAVIGRALAKDPADRYQSASAFADDIRRFLANLPVTARVPGSVEQLRRFVRRRPLLSAGIAGAVVVAIVTSWLWLDARAARRRADLRNNELILREARTALVRDPTAALGWLRQLSDTGVDAQAAWAIADEAFGRGVADLDVQAHTDEIHWIEPLPDGRGFVSGSYDGTALIWQGSPVATDHRVLARCPTGRVHLVRPSPDGARFAVGCDDGDGYIVDKAGSQLVQFRGHRGDVQRIEWTRDGTLITADDHGGVVVWPHGTAPGHALIGPTTGITSLALSSDDRAVVAGEAAGIAWRWSIDGGDAVSVKTGVRIVGIGLVHDTLTTIDGDGNVRTYHDDGGHALELQHEVAVGLKCKHAQVANDGSFAVLAGIGGNVSVVTGDRVDIIATHRAQIRTVAISPDGTRIASGGDDSDIQVVERAMGRRQLLRGHRDRVRHVAFAGDHLLSSDGDGSIRTWPVTGVSTSVLVQPGSLTDRAAGTRDRVATIDTTGEVALWDTHASTRHPLGHVDGHASAMVLAGDTPIVGTSEGTIAWATSHGIVTHKPGRIVSSIALSRDGLRVAAATSNGPIALYDARGGEIATLAGNTNGTEVVAFDPTGALLASGGQDRVIRVWQSAGEPAQLVELVQLPGPTGDTHVVAFSPSGDRLVAASNDGGVRSWPVRAGVVDTRMTRLAHHTGVVTAIAFSPNGAWLVSAGRDRTVIRTSLTDQSAETTMLPAAAMSLEISDDGMVRAVTTAGSVERWSGSSPPVVEIDHGVRSGALIGDDKHLAVVLEDGAVFVPAARVRTLDDLRDRLGRVER